MLNSVFVYILIGFIKENQNPSYQLKGRDREKIEKITPHKKKKRNEREINRVRLPCLYVLKTLMARYKG